jgi:hypothetical protein
MVPRECLQKLTVSLAKTLGVLSFTPLTMLQAYAQAVDVKVGHHFGEGQGQHSEPESYETKHGQDL